VRYTHTACLVKAEIFRTEENIKEHRSNKVKSFLFLISPLIPTYIYLEFLIKKEKKLHKSTKIKLVWPFTSNARRENGKKKCISGNRC
jgi:hypothetical protein